MWRAFKGRGDNLRQRFLPRKAVVQVLVLDVAAGFVADALAVQLGNGLGGFLPGEVIVEVTMDVRIPL